MALVVCEALPVRKLPIANLDQPGRGNDADDRFGSGPRDVSSVRSSDRELDREVGLLGDAGPDLKLRARAQHEAGLKRRGSRWRDRRRAGDKSKIDASWSLAVAPLDLLAQRRELHVGQRVLDDDQEVGVAVARSEVTEHKRAVNDRRHDRVA